MAGPVLGVVDWRALPATDAVGKCDSRQFYVRCFLLNRANSALKLPLSAAAISHAALQY
jgi:hypothetical protein